MISDPQPGDPRVQLESRLAALFHLLRHLESLQDEKDAVYARHAHRFVPYAQRWRAGMYWLWVLICTIVLTVIAAVASVAVITMTSATAQSDGSAGTAIAAVAFFLMPVPVSLLLAGVIVAIHNARLAAGNAKRELRNRETAAEIDALLAPEVAPLDRQLAEGRRAYREGYDGWFPEKLLSSTDVGACWQIVHDHRATTVQEVVNRYRTDQHEQFLRDAATAQLTEQQRATRVAQVNGILNVGMQGAMMGTIRAEGAATRAAIRDQRF